MPMTRKAGIQSHERMLGHEEPTMTATIGTHHSRIPLFCETRSFGSQHEVAALEIPSFIDHGCSFNARSSAGAIR